MYLYVFLMLSDQTKIEFSHNLPYFSLHYIFLKFDWYIIDMHYRFTYTHHRHFVPGHNILCCFFFFPISFFSLQPLFLFLVLQPLASFIFLSDAPWLFYQDAEYLFYTHDSEWASFEFVCGWLRGDLLTIHSAHEQEFIHSKIKLVLEYNSP